ncbi:MAG TPA: transposase [Pyrinomonadaceae bacterium]|nr:transposase [Pyrinomonadaceae bacterium]
MVADIMKIIEKSYKFRSRGFPPRLTDAEVITMEICGEFFKLHEDTEIFKYFKQHYLDTLPLPVATYTRGGFRDKRFALQAEFGHCASKKLNYYGFKLGLRITRSGMITHFPLLSARTHDTNHLGALIEGFSGTVPADKGFLDAYQTELWQLVQNTQVVEPPRRNMNAAPEQVKLVRKTKYRRKPVETVGSQLTERFQITKIKVKDLRHYQNRIFRKILSHKVGVFINMQNGNKALHLALLDQI